MTLPLKSLIEKMEQIKPMPEGLKWRLMNETERIEIKKKEIILKPGRICDHLYYIEKGMLGCFKKEDDRDSYVWFMFEGDIATSVTSFNARLPSTEYMIAVEPCIAHTLSYKMLESLCEEFSEFAAVRQQLTNLYYILSWDIGDARKNGPEGLYSFLLNKYQENLYRIPVASLASFMGISKTTLNKIQKKVNK
jgi:signal-transduction protein with cAMP-binding, CBS, and nucleotidyltransferase domain